MASGLNLTYREFGPEGTARVAFFQNLTYEVGAKITTFKSTELLSSTPLRNRLPSLY